MEWMGNTISEHYILIGEKRGEKRGEIRGEKRGEKRGEQRGILKGELQSLERLLREGMIDQAYFDSACVKLQAELAQLEKTPKRAPVAKRAS